MRLPKQSGAVNLYENIFGTEAPPNSPCQGVAYRGPQDLGRVIFNAVDGPNFCSLSRSLASGTLGCGVSLF